MYLTRGARVENEAPWSLFATLWLRLVGNVPLGAWLELRYFFIFFSTVERALLGMPNARRIHYSFCAMRLFSLSNIARVKGGAESALERFEELQKELKKSLFVGSAVFHSLSESCWI